MEYLHAQIHPDPKKTGFSWKSHTKPLALEAHALTPRARQLSNHVGKIYAVKDQINNIATTSFYFEVTWVNKKYLFMNPKKPNISIFIIFNMNQKKKIHVDFIIGHKAKNTKVASIEISHIV